MRHPIVMMIVGLLGVPLAAFGYGPFVYLYQVGYLGQIDLATGELEPIAAMNANLRIVALAYHPDGHLYGVGETPSDGMILYQIEPTTGTATVIGPTGVEPQGSFNWTDLTADDAGVLWLLEEDDLYVVDLVTGEATLHCSQQNPDVAIRGLAAVGATLYTMQASPAPVQSLDCGLVAAGVWEDVGFWGYALLDGSPGGALFGLKSKCNPGDCTSWSNYLYILDPDSGHETLVAQHHNVTFTGLAFPPRDDQPPTEGVPTLGGFGLVLLCGLVAVAGMLVLWFRNRT